MSIRVCNVYIVRRRFSPSSGSGACRPPSRRGRLPFQVAQLPGRHVMSKSGGSPNTSPDSVRTCDTSPRGLAASTLLDLRCRHIPGPGTPPLPPGTARQRYGSHSKRYGHHAGHGGWAIHWDPPFAGSAEHCDRHSMWHSSSLGLHGRMIPAWYPFRVAFSSQMYLASRVDCRSDARRHI